MMKKALIGLIVVACATGIMQAQGREGGGRGRGAQEERFPTPQQFAAYIKEDTERWAPVIRASGAKVE